MNRKTKQKLFSGCMAAAFVLSSAFTPIVANAAGSNVTRIGGYDQYATAALMAQNGWTGTSANVVISAGQNYALVDALAAGPLATKLEAPILLTDNESTLNASAKAELLRLKPTKAYVTSGTAVIKQSVLNEISAMGITVVQLGGYDQYETSVNIAKEMAKQGVNISRVVLAAGWLSPADALSIAPIAAAQGMPILTTTQGQLPVSVKTYLDSIKANVTDSYVVGGTAVVSDVVKGQLTGNVERYFGLTKYDTNVQILKDLATEYKNDKVYVANGETLVDALAVVPLAAKSGSPVVLVHQQLANTTTDFVKLNMSTDNMVAVGGEVVVPTAGMNVLTSEVSYSTDGATVGSTDSTTPLMLTDNVRITGDNVTLENAIADYSVYIKGNNVTLNNVIVQGTVFVDPGDTGSATLDGVTAVKIVVLSGASDSINITNTTAGVLTVDSSSNVHVVANGTTTIGATVVRTFTILDANGGSLGDVFITSTPGQNPVIELRGTFTEPIVVAGDMTLVAAEGAVIPSVVINNENPEQVVTLDGQFVSVEVNSPGQVVLAADTDIQSMEVSALVEITIPAGSSIVDLDPGSTGTLVSGGGDVNGEETTSTPSLPSTPSNPPAPGGGGGGGSTSSTEIVSFAIKDGSANVGSATVNGTSGTADLTGISNNDQRISAIQITASPADSTLTLTGIGSSNGTMTFSDKSFSLSSSITMDQLLGDAISDGDVSLGSLRAFFGTYVTFNGTLSKTGYTTSNVSLRLDLGTAAGAVLDNEWALMTVNESTREITANVKTGKGSTLLSTMGVYNLLSSSIGVLPSSVSTNTSDYYDPSSESGRTSIKAGIVTLIGSGTWETATLGQLDLETIRFKDQDNNTWKLNFSDPS